MGACKKRHLSHTLHFEPVQMQYNAMQCMRDNVCMTALHVCAFNPSIHAFIQMLIYAQTFIISDCTTSTNEILQFYPSEIPLKRRMFRCTSCVFELINEMS